MIMMTKPIFDSEENNVILKRSKLASKNIVPLQSLEIQAPMMLKLMSHEETKEYHLKKLEKLSVKSLGEIPQVQEPNEEKKQWVIRRMKGSSKSWETWDQ